MDMTKRLLAVGFIITATRLFAQLPVDGVHYAAGQNGLGAGIPESTGFYARDDNWIFTGSQNHPFNFHTFVYMQAPQLMWLSQGTILGAHYGADVMIPLVYKEENNNNFVNVGLPPRIEVRSFTYQRGGLGDIKIEPLLLVWQWDQLDLMAGGAVWVPSGYYNSQSPVNLGNNSWSPMVTLDAAWHPDEAKTWTISVANHFEYNFQDPSPFYLPLATYTLEAAVGKTIFDHVDAGVAGYYQQQINQQIGSTPFLNQPIYNNDSSVAGAGPEISYRIPDWDLAISVNYDHEFEAHDRPRGNVVDLTVTKRF